MPKLTPKQKRFIDEYMIDLNATQAAIRAGYSSKRATQIGYENLTKPYISRAIQEKMAELAQKTELKAEWVLNELMDISQKCQQKTPVMVFSPETRRKEHLLNESGEGVWEFDSTGANRALELLGKHLNLFTDKLKLDATVTINVTGNVSTDCI